MRHDTTPPGGLARTALVALSAACACAGAATPAPQRIVALSPSLTETVCALGRCAALVATDRHSEWPAQVGGLPKVGGLEDAQIERIVALSPDLVLLGPRSRAGGRLQSLGVNAQTLDARSHADLRRTLTRLGELLGEPERAARLSHRIDEQIEEAARRIAPTWRGATVYAELSADPVAAGPGSFIGETLARLGLLNIVGADAGLFPRLNPEHVVRSQPDLIIGPASTLRDLVQRPGWAHLNAVKQRRICVLDEHQFELFSRPGPRVGEAALMLSECLRTLPVPTH